MNPLVELHVYGQSFWYDNIRRKYLYDETLHTLIDSDGLRGMTSNPAIFEKAIGGSDDYDGQIGELVAKNASTSEIYEALVITDIKKACDMFSEVYSASQRADGFVSLEVSPLLARDTAGTIAEARRLSRKVDRPNLMIKVPATAEGIPAIRTLIGEGISVNVTLMFNMAHYEAVAQAYIAGLNDLVAAGGNPSQVASVASFFVSRVDSAVDAALEALNDPVAEALIGKIAIANSKVTYQRFKEIFQGDAFAALRKSGARPQRVLWASTSTKNPAFPDTLYVDALIGPGTVNTMPPQTVDAFRKNGTLSSALLKNVDVARAQLAQLDELGIDLSAITEKLQEDGVASFAAAFDNLMAAIATKAATFIRLNRQVLP
jgi:transaldolase